MGAFFRGYYREVLKRSLESKKKKNSAYSIRAFCRKLDCDPSFFCKVIAGQKHLSLGLAKRMAEKLELDEHQKRKFLLSVVEDISERASYEASKHIGRRDLLPEVCEFPQSSFERVGHIAALGILESSSLDEGGFSVELLAEKFSLSREEAQSFIEILTAEGLLEEVDGKVVKTHSRMVLSPGQCSEAFKDYHREIFDQSRAHLDNFSQSAMTLNSMTIAVDVTKLPEARRMIDQFILQLSDFLEQGNKTRVYQVALQLFPLDGGKSTSPP